MAYFERGTTGEQADPAKTAHTEVFTTYMSCRFPGYRLVPQVPDGLLSYERFWLASSASKWILSRKGVEQRFLAISSLHRGSITPQYMLLTSHRRLSSPFIEIRQVPIVS